MKLTTERLEQILGSKIDPIATHLAIYEKHVFAERTTRPVHNLEDLREILDLRKKVERLESQQLEVVIQAEVVELKREARNYKGSFEVLSEQCSRQAKEIDDLVATIQQLQKEADNRQQ